jgi:hypothetical protein
VLVLPEHDGAHDGKHNGNRRGHENVGKRYE